MGWFAVGGVLGAMLCILYIVALCVPKSRAWLAENVFDKTIYGDVLEYVDQDDSDLISPVDLSVGIFVVLLCTILLSIVIFLLSLAFNYILLFVVILFLSAFIISNIIRNRIH